MVAKREALCHATGKILAEYQTIFLIKGRTWKLLPKPKNYQVYY